MRYFESDGLWYTSDDPSKLVAGTLIYSEDELNLELIGNFTEGWFPGIVTYDRIFGVVGECPYGHFVTLVDSFLSGKKINSAGIGAERIFSHQALIGRAHVTDPGQTFESIDLVPTYLTDWLGDDRFHALFPVPGTMDEFSIQYRKPKTFTVHTVHETIDVAYSITSNNSKQDAGLSDQVHLLLKPKANLEQEAIVSRYLNPVRDLMTFATDTPNGIDEVVLRSPQAEQNEAKGKFGLVFNPVFKVDEKDSKDPLHASDMLFTFGDTRDANLNIFENWFKFDLEHKGFTAVYFGYRMTPPKYADERFLRLLSAFTLLCKKTCGSMSYGRRIHSAIEGVLAGLVSEGESSLLKAILPTPYEIEMPFYLLSLLDEYGELTDDLMGGDRRGFATSIINTLDYVERREIEPERKRFEDRSMYVAMLVIELLIKVVVLGELGFDRRRIFELIRRNNNYKKLNAMASSG